MSDFVKSYLLILGSRGLDVVSFVIFAPIFIYYFGFEYAHLVEYASISACLSMFIKLSFDAIVIKRIKTLKNSKNVVMADVFAAKCLVTLISFTASLFILCVMKPGFGFLNLFFPLLLVCVAEILNTSQFTLIFKSALSVFMINIFKIAIISISLCISIVSENLLVYVYGSALALVLSSLSHLFLNLDRGSFCLPKISAVTSTLEGAFRLFSLRIFGTISDKVMLLLAALYLTDSALIYLDLSLKGLLLLSTPAIIFFNFVRSRDIPINIKYICFLITICGISGACVHYLTSMYFAVDELSNVMPSLIFISSIIFGMIVFSNLFLILLTDSVAIQAELFSSNPFINFSSFILLACLYGFLGFTGVNSVFIFILSFYTVGCCLYVYFNGLSFAKVEN